MTNINKVTILSSLPPIKGISPYTVELIQELEKRVEVQALSFKSMYPEFLYPGKTKDESVRAPNFKNTKVHQHITWYNPLSWVSAGRKVEGDVFHVQWWSWVLAPIYWVIIKLAKSRTKQVVITVHNVMPHEKSSLKNYLNRKIFQLADKFIVHSHANKELLRHEYPNRPIKVIAHGIISSKVTSLSKEEARKQLNIDPEKQVLLFFGNVRPYKGLDDLLLAFKELKEKSSNLFLIIAGQAWEDWGKYQAIIYEYDLSDSILRLNHFVSEGELEKVFKASDLLVLPYKHFDAQSGVGAVGLFFELPIMVSKIGGLEEIALDEDFVFWPEDSAELATKIKHFFRAKPETRTRIKELKKSFLWDTITESTLDFYES